MNNYKDILPKDNWLQGKTILITGATSGIGRALAVLLYENGSTVITHGRSQERIDESGIFALGNDIITVTGDLGEPDGWRSIESIILERAPQVMILNAGYNCRKDYASGWINKEIFEMMQVNLISHIYCTRTFASLPRLPEPRRLGFILSTSCHYARPQMSLYVAAKMGLMGFGKALQQESKQLGIHSILFYPGRTDTGFRKTPNQAYMKPESVAILIASVLSLPNDIVPYEFTFRPEVDINI